MPTISPQTIKVDAPKPSSTLKVAISQTTEPPKRDLAGLTEISIAAIEKNNQAQGTDSAEVISETAEDIIRVTSTIGRSGSARNLTNNQAIEIYQKIAKLL